MGIDSFTDALNDNNLRVAVLQEGCATLDEAFTIAVRLEAIISTTPSDCKISHGLNGQQTDRANARMISAAATTACPSWPDLARPSPSYSTSGYGESINETSYSSGSQRSSHNQPQEPSQQQGLHYE